MRIAVAALCVLTTLVVATPVSAQCWGNMPPKSARREPTVPYDYVFVSDKDLVKYCSARTQFSCTYPAPTPAQPDRWVLVVKQSLSFEEIECSEIYERAHMPPNYWFDPARELPETQKLLTEMKQTGRTHY